MPHYKAHLVGGLGAFGLVYYGIFLGNASPDISLEWLSCALIGAMFPDIDTQSKGRKMYYVFLSILGLFFFFKADMYALSCISFLMLIPPFLTHRGMTHSFIFIVLLSLCVVYYAQIHFPIYCTLIASDALFFAAGAGSHILLDRCATIIKKYLGKSYS